MAAGDLNLSSRVLYGEMGREVRIWTEEKFCDNLFGRFSHLEIFPTTPLFGFFQIIFLFLKIFKIFLTNSFRQNLSSIFSVVLNYYSIFHLTRL